MANMRGRETLEKQVMEKTCMLKGIKNTKQKEARVLSHNFRSCFSSGSCGIVCEERANTALNVWRDLGEPMYSFRRKGGQLGTASLT